MMSPLFPDLLNSLNFISTSVRPPSKGELSTEDVMDVILTANGPYKTSAGVRTSFTARIRPNVKVIETAMKQLQKAAILDKTVEKFFPTPSSLKQCCWVFKRKPDP